MADNIVNKNGDYTDKNIKALESLEHIRLRPGMYIGSLGNGESREDGLYILLKEVIDNSIDEFNNVDRNLYPNVNTIEVDCDGKTVRVRDYGRGIPQKSLVDCVSKINCGAKFSDEVFKCSIGLNGVGLKAVNALSSSFEAKSYREGKVFSCHFKGGKLLGKNSAKAKADDTGTEIKFTPEDQKDFFENYEYNLDIIREMLWDYAYLNRGLCLIFNGEKIRSKNGLKDLLKAKIGDAQTIYDIVGYSNKTNTIEIAFCHIADNYNEEYYSYANGQYTIYGGTHQSYLKEGLLKGFNSFFQKDWQPSDVREGMIAAIAIKIENPRFDSQTKSKLTNTEIKNKVIDFTRESVVDYLLKNKNSANIIKDKITQSEKAHRELQEARKSAKTLAARVKLNIPKLKDCKYHINDKKQKDREKARGNMIFICEGDSAAGSFIPVRDVEKQAVFPVRGKVLNVEKKKKEKAIYDNEELYNLIATLGIENDLENLRYDKVVIATDADNDGFHIRLLLMTFFINFYPTLVKGRKLWILETPLFKVRNKTAVEYCYTEAERDAAIAKLPGAEVTRFKGLGEIDSSDFRKFIREDIKLTPVFVDNEGEIKNVISFYMGDNSPERKQFIIDNLITDIEI